MREDIYGGLKNAMERGATLEQAISSFVKSGYNEAEVREAADNIESVSSLTSSSQTTNVKQPVALAPKKPSQILPSQHSEINQVRRKGKKSSKIILLVAILLILIGLLVFTIIFREKVVEYLTSFF